MVYVRFIKVLEIMTLIENFKKSIYYKFYSRNPYRAQKLKVIYFLFGVTHLGYERILKEV